MKLFYFPLALLLALFPLSTIHALPDVAEIRENITTTQSLYSLAYVDFFFLDIFGNLKSITVPAEKAPSILKYGLFFDGSSVAGYKAIAESDLRAQPDLESIFLLPWGTPEIRTLAIMCDVYDSNGALHPHSPRTVLKNSIERARNAGFTPYCGVELEFYLLKPNQQGMLEPLDTYGYCDAIANPYFKSFQNELLNGLMNAGIDIEKAHHEVSAGQHEIVLKYDNPITAADSLVMTKYIIQAAARTQGLVVCFMPKPFAYQNGSGMHVHVSLFDPTSQKNAFYDATTSSKLSKTALHFIAGNINRLPETELLMNSSVNSFKRLVPGYEAPVYICWGKKNRSAALRIPDVSQENLISNDGAGMRVEFRIPDGSCNPYLAFAAIIEAGLKGIELQEEAPQPIEHNLYKYTQQQLADLHIATIAASLCECIENYKHSVFVQSFLGASLHAKLLEEKEDEWNSYQEENSEDDTSHIITNWEKRHHGLM